jgi:hypothetical protein
MISPFLTDLIDRRASYGIWRRYRINKLELWLLRSLYAFTVYCNRPIVNKTEWFETVSGNLKFRRKMEGYLIGLFRSQVVGAFEYISLPGSFSIGISEFGYEVLRRWAEDRQKLVDKYGQSLEYKERDPKKFRSVPFSQIVHDQKARYLTKLAKQKA